ncbi:MAG TPA: hypothetical protein VLB79_11775 [Solirubrobacterales bacterium]|nr:hypothetical protein [Solirubrobacterales bacterium]
MSGARRRGLLRLAVVVAVVLIFVFLTARGLFSGGGSSAPPRSETRHSATPPARPDASTLAVRLPEPLHGATAAPAAGGLLVIGGADRNDVSTDQVLRLDPSRRTVSSAGTLSQALHDAAAAAVGGRTLVFGGGAATTFDTIQELTPGGTASVVGRLPAPASDLSAVSLGGAAYVVGGYDGRTPLGTVLRAGAAGRPVRVGDLPTPVRYTALAAAGGRLLSFGGELGDGSDTDLIQEYDPTTRRASIVGRLSQPVSHASALVLDGWVYLLGGRRRGAASAQILRFDLATGKAARAGRLPSPLFDAAAGVSSGVGYLVGGIDAGGTSVDSVVAVRP